MQLNNCIMYIKGLLIYANVYTYVHVCTLFFMFSYYISLHIYMYLSIYLSMYLCMYVCIFLSIYLCIYLSIQSPVPTMNESSPHSVMGTSKTQYTIDFGKTDFNLPKINNKINMSKYDICYILYNT